MDIVQIGIGPLGRRVVQYITEREGVTIAGAVDVDPELIGRDLGDVCEIGPLGVPISDNLATAIEGQDVSVAVITSLSSVVAVENQIAAAAEAGLNIVSTCEELSFSLNINPDVSQRIDEVCKANKVACVGTGVNPGFLMDYLPSVLTSICQQVEKVEIYRVQDASPRRIPFQQKIGAGLNDEQFQAKVKTGTLRHVGLPESADMIATSLGWKFDKIEDTLEPVIAEERITTGYIPIEPGIARGVKQVFTGFINGVEKMSLHFLAAVGEPESYDKIIISGNPSFESVIPGGINGDVATSAITVNAIRAITRAQPGLRTMLDLPVPGWFADI